MRGDAIPLVTWYIAGTNKSFKKPKYELRTMEEEKEHQKKLGNCLGFYYGIRCKKCCGVYPAFHTTGGFKDEGYYVCLVCGKESEHQPMEWQARDSWNAEQYIWQPSDDEFRQMTINDWMKGAI